MNLKKVDPRKIKVPDVRVTGRMDEETTQQFVLSVKTTGIDEPIKCFLVDGELWLSDGLHRLEVALKSGFPSVDVTVREGSMADVYCNNLMSGHLRGTHPVSEMVRSIEKLMTEFSLDSESIAKKTGMTRDYVEKLMEIAQLSPMCRAFLDEGKLKVGHCESLTKISDFPLQETAAQSIVTYRMSVADAKQYIQMLLDAQEPQPEIQTPQEPPPPPMIKCAYCGESYELGQIANPSTCRECSQTLFLAMAQARQELANHQRAEAEARRVSENEAMT